MERALEEDRAKADALARQAQVLKDEIRTLRRDMVAAAQTAQDLEEALSATEQALAELEAERVEKLAALREQRDRLVRTLGALQRIAIRPPEVALAAPGSPVDALRSARLLSVAVPIIERGMTLPEFAHTYVRWIAFSRSGLPAWSFKLASWLRGMVFWAGLLLGLVSLAAGHWLGGLLLLGILAAGVVAAGVMLWQNIDIQRLTRSADRIEQGDLGIEVEIRSNDEIGQLARSFRTMTGHLIDDITDDKQVLIESSGRQTAQIVTTRELLLVDMDFFRVGIYTNTG